MIFMIFGFSVFSVVSTDIVVSCDYEKDFGKGFGGGIRS